MAKPTIETLAARLGVQAEHRPALGALDPSSRQSHSANAALKFALVALALLLAACEKATPTTPLAASESPSAVTAAAPSSPPATAAAPLSKEQWLSRIESTYTKFAESDEGDGVTKFAACFSGWDPTRKQCPGEFASAKRDGFRKLRFYKPGIRNSLTIDSYVHSHISLPDGERPRVVVAPYYFSKRGWLFLRSVAFLADGEVVFEKEFEGSDVQRDNSEIGVEERAAFIVVDSELDDLLKVAGAKVLKIRMTGEKGYVNLSPKDVDTIKREVALLLKINDRMVNALDAK
jgi:hypothetical protein